MERLGCGTDGCNCKTGSTDDGQKTFEFNNNAMIRTFL